MRNRLLAATIAGTCLTVLPLATAASASADTATVTPDQCYAAGGYFGGYNADALPFCTEGADNNDVLSYDPLQGDCPDGQHMAWAYLEGFVCTPDVPNT